MRGVVNHCSLRINLAYKGPTSASSISPAHRRIGGFCSWHRNAQPILWTASVVLYFRMLKQAGGHFSLCLLCFLFFGFCSFLLFFLGFPSCGFPLSILRSTLTLKRSKPTRNQPRTNLERNQQSSTFHPIWNQPKFNSNPALSHPDEPVLQPGPPESQT